MQYKVKIQKNIRSRRLELGLSQRELGERCGMTDRYISSLENSPHNVTIDSLEELARGLECSIFELMGTEKPAKRQKAERKKKEFKIPKSALVGLDVASKLISQAKRDLSKG